MKSWAATHQHRHITELPGLRHAHVRQNLFCGAYVHEEFVTNDRHVLTAATKRYVSGDGVALPQNRGSVHIRMEDILNTWFSLTMVNYTTQFWGLGWGKGSRF